jgi:hypothetical protein
MATVRQIEANRRNAQLSHGPRSIEGKAASRFNALKTGIHAKSHVIPGEDPAELEALTEAYHEQFQPAAPLENFLVDALVTADWKLRRLRKVEAELWAQKLAKVTQLTNYNEECARGQAYEWHEEAFTRLQRKIDSTERSYYRALKQLQRIENAGDSVPAPAEAPETPVELGSFRTTPSAPSAEAEPHLCPQPVNGSPKLKVDS